MRKLYVVWQNDSGGFESSEVEVNSKINPKTVELAVRLSLSYSRRLDFSRIISWQVMEDFTNEEEDEFWKSYPKMI